MIAAKPQQGEPMKAKTPRLTPEAKKVADVLELRMADTISPLLAIPKKVVVRVTRANTPESGQRILDWGSGRRFKDLSGRVLFLYFFPRLGQDRFSGRLAR